MKRLLLMTMILVGVGLSSFGQTAAPAKPSTQTTAVKKTTAKTVTGPATATTVHKTVTSTSTAPTKADGSRDMRYKANKESVKTTSTTTHVKKNGTPDKRYKENKKMR